MPALSRLRVHKQVAPPASVEVSERNGVRYLHLGSETVQSAMRLTQPNHLELSYTRCMMAFLLFVPPPARVVMIGLGGGSLAKFVYHKMPKTRITAVEINPGVPAIAREFFQLPNDPDRLEVQIGDGMDYVRGCSSRSDLLLVDGYGTDERAPQLATPGFYETCAAALSDSGVLVTNLFRREKGLDTHLRLLKETFAGRVLCLTDDRRGNLIAMAFMRGLGQPKWKALHARATRLAEVYGLEFPSFLDSLRLMNTHDGGCLPF
jgi:spermidine synthase